MNAGWSTVAMALALAWGLTDGSLARGLPQVQTPPQVDIVAVVGCAQKASGVPPRWMLTNASEPTVMRDPYASEDALDEATRAPLGSNTFRLVGVAEYLTEEDRGELDQAENPVIGFQRLATGQLQDGHKVAIRGLLVEVNDEQRINLTSVISLADSCR